MSDGGAWGSTGWEDLRVEGPGFLSEWGEGWGSGLKTTPPQGQTASPRCVALWVSLTRRRIERSGFSLFHFHHLFEPQGSLPPVQVPWPLDLGHNRVCLGPAGGYIPSGALCGPFPGLGPGGDFPQDRGHFW